MSEIRVTYSGLIGLAVGLGSVITGVVFTLIVTRKLSQEEFGTWGLINGLIIYVTIIEPIVSYWATREIARGEKSAKTALASSSVFSIIGLLAYILIAYFIGKQSDAQINVLFLASILVPVILLNYTLNAINLGWKPQLISYGFLVFEITKIVAALVLVYFLLMGINGAILATFIGYLASIITQIKFARTIITGKIRKEFFRKWLKLFWLPVYRNVPPILFYSDVVIFSIITGSVVGIAYYSAASSIAKLVGYTGSLSKSVYPKLLGGGKKGYLEENLVMSFYFSFPIFMSSIALAKPALYALNPIYEVAVPIVIIMSARYFLSTINKSLQLFLHGIEDVDENTTSSFRDYVKSRLFLIPTVRFIQYGAYTATMIVVLLLLASDNYSQLDLVTYWSVIALVTEIPFTVYFAILVQRNFRLNLDYKSILKYFVAGLGSFGFMYILTEKFLIYKNSIFEFLPNLLLFVAIGIAIYLVTTYFVDLRTRNLFKSIINEIVKKPSNK